MLRLQDSVAIITGASRGIGRAIALRFAQEGAKVVGFSRDASTLSKLADYIREAGGVCEVVAGSVASSQDVVRLLETTVLAFGGIDILVNNAGITDSKPFMELTEADWDRILDTNLKGMFLCSLVVAREMARHGGGRIINMGSIAGYQVPPSDPFVPYHTSKGGIAQLTRAMAVALCPYNIIVNGIAPGAIRTDMTKDRYDGHEAEIVTRIPMKRIGQPEDVAELALILATENTKYLLGQVILLDGGRSLVL